MDIISLAILDKQGYSFIEYVDEYFIRIKCNICSSEKVVESYNIDRIRKCYCTSKFQDNKDFLKKLIKDNRHKDYNVVSCNKEFNTVTLLHNCGNSVILSIKNFYDPETLKCECQKEIKSHTYDNHISYQEVKAKEEKEKYNRIKAIQKTLSSSPRDYNKKTVKKTLNRPILSYLSGDYDGDKIILKTIIEIIKEEKERINKTKIKLDKLKSLKHFIGFYYFDEILLVFDYHNELRYISLTKFRHKRHMIKLVLFPYDRNVVTVSSLINASTLEMEIHADDI